MPTAAMFFPARVRQPLKVCRGFDTAAAPSPTRAKQLLEEVGGAFWGVYIGGPCSGGSGWTPELVRAYAEHGIEQFLPIYVGQQSSSICHAHTLTHEQGLHDGREAAELMREFGWGRGAPCALDVEKGASDADPSGAVAYTNGFCSAMRAAGYSPGVYGAGDFVARLERESDCPTFVFVAHWLRPPPDQSPDPSEIPGFPETAWADARVWQYAGDTTFGGVNVDINVGKCRLAGPPGGG